jgi:hypothetical protein
MTTIKSYTDIEQSKKLAEILPIESADMWWSRCTITDFGDGVLKVSYAVEPCNISQFRNTKEDIPCWSLAALLELLPKRIEIVDNVYELSVYLYGLYYWNINNGNLFFESKDKDNLVDACVEMIIRLNGLNLL